MGNVSSSGQRHQPLCSAERKGLHSVNRASMEKGRGRPMATMEAKGGKGSVAPDTSPLFQTLTYRYKVKDPLMNEVTEHKGRRTRT